MEKKYTINQLRAAWGAGRYKGNHQESSEPNKKPARGWGHRSNSIDFREDIPAEIHDRVKRDVAALLFGLAPEELYDLYFKAIEMADTLIMGTFRPTGIFLTLVVLDNIRNQSCDILEERFPDYYKRLGREYERRWPNGHL